MKKNIISVVALCMLAQLSSAQVMYDDIVTVEYKDADGKVQVWEERSCEDGVQFSFVGAKGKVENGREGSDAYYADVEENADAYVYESKHVMDAWLWNELSLYTHVSVSDCKGGICVSTSSGPVISEIIPTSQLDNVYQCDGMANFTIYGDCDSNGDSQYVLSGLDYHKAYYVRPFVKFDNGQIMYGGEKMFTTPYTFESVVLFEPEAKDLHGIYNDMFLNKDAMTALADAEYLASEDVRQGMMFELKNRLFDVDEENIKKNAYRKIECVDGTMYFVNKLPEAFVKTFREEVNPNSMKPIEFVTDSASVNMDVNDNGATMFTKNAVTPISSMKYKFDESLGLPDVDFLDIVPIAGNANPAVAFDIPRYLWGREYSLYAVFVRIDALGKLGIEGYDPEDMRSYKFYVNIIERNDMGEYKNSTRLKNPADGTNYYINNAENLVDTLYLGDYAFSSKPGGMIQLQSQVSSRQTTMYSREILISKFILVPKEKE